MFKLIRRTLKSSLAAAVIAAFTICASAAIASGSRDRDQTVSAKASAKSSGSAKRSAKRSRGRSGKAGARRGRARGKHRRARVEKPKLDGKERAQKRSLKRLRRTVRKCRRTDFPGKHPGRARGDCIRAARKEFRQERRERFEDAETKIRLLSARQSDILEEGGLRVKVIGGHKGRIKLRGYSSTFDTRGRFRKLTRTRSVKFKYKGQRRRVDLYPNAAGAAEIASCGARELKVTAGRAEGKVKSMIRTTPECEPKQIDVSRAQTATGQHRCEYVATQVDTECMYPFPNDYYTLPLDKDSYGRKLNFVPSAMPADPKSYYIFAGLDDTANGFDPDQPIVLKVPGLDNPIALARTGVNGINNPGGYGDPNAPIVVIDNTAGNVRVPIWTELASTPTNPPGTVVLIHPFYGFPEGHRLVVGMTDLKDAAGNVLPAPEGFRYYRDDLRSSNQIINQRRSAFERFVFRPLRSAGMTRSQLYLAWDFTIAGAPGAPGTGR